MYIVGTQTEDYGFVQVVEGKELSAADDLAHALWKLAYKLMTMGDSLRTIEEIEVRYWSPASGCHPPEAHDLLDVYGDGEAHLREWHNKLPVDAFQAISVVDAIVHEASHGIDTVDASMAQRRIAAYHDQLHEEAADPAG